MKIKHMLGTLPTSLRVCVDVGVGPDINSSQVWSFLAYDNGQCPKYQSGLMLEKSSLLYVRTNLCQSFAHQAFLEQVTNKKTAVSGKNPGFCFIALASPFNCRFAKNVDLNCGEISMLRKNIYCVLGIWRIWHDMTCWMGRDDRRNDTSSLTSIVVWEQWNLWRTNNEHSNHRFAKTFWVIFEGF
jgi:hypothetical protein